MKVKILHRFHDKADYMKVYLVGDTVTMEDSRAEYLIGRGLVEKVVDEPVIELVQPSVEAKAVKPVAARRKSTPKEE